MDGQVEYIAIEKLDILELLEILTLSMQLCQDDIIKLGNNGFELCKKNYLLDMTSKIIHQKNNLEGRI